MPCSIFKNGADGLALLPWWMFQQCSLFERFSRLQMQILKTLYSYSFFNLIFVDLIIYIHVFRVKFYIFCTNICCVRSIRNLYSTKTHTKISAIVQKLGLIKSQSVGSIRINLFHIYLNRDIPCILTKNTQKSYSQIFYIFSQILRI